MVSLNDKKGITMNRALAFLCAKNNLLRIVIMGFSILFLTTELSAHNKIVFLISPPRSLSTAFLRMIQARGDFQVMQEPFTTASRTAQDQKSPEVLRSFELVKNEILKKAETSHVFVKEISQWVKDCFLNDKDFLKRDNVYFIFLARNPHHATLSLCKKRKPEEVEQGIISKFAAYEALYTIFTHIKNHAINSPRIILAEDLYTDVKSSNQTLCNYLKIPYLEDALQWSPLGSNFSGKSWDHASNDNMAWHQDVLNSSSIHMPTQYKVDINGNPTFEEVPTAAMKQECIKAYTESLSFYNQLLVEREYLLKK